MKTYLAARYSRRQEMEDFKQELRTYGYDVISRWVRSDHAAKWNDADNNPENWKLWAEDDVEDIGICDVLVLFTEKVTPQRGGRLVEMGMGLALNKMVVVIGPLENVFCCLPDVIHYESKEAFIADLKKLNANDS